MDLINRLKARALRWALPLPLQCRHIEYSAISSIDDQAGLPDRRLIEVSLAAIHAAQDIDLSEISAKMQAGPYYPDIWPGEHYRLLSGFVQTLRPRRVIEIGTFQGLSALALLKHLPAEGRVTTVDIVPWKNVASSVLSEADFAGGRLTQVLGDLSERPFFDSFAPQLAECDLLFVDAPKNVVFERTFLSFLEGAKLAPGCIVIFDDIRQWNMLEIWRGIRKPKLDLTSFGHWTGTGVVAWNERS